jgi:hypothetical protein
MKHYRIYSPISRLAYKSDTFLEANFEVFAIFSPLSRYQFLPELVDNFRSMNSYIYWFQIKIFSKKTPIINCLLNNQIYTIALIHFTCILLKYGNATSIFNIKAIFSTNHTTLLELNTDLDLFLKHELQVVQKNTYLLISRLKVGHRLLDQN